MKRNIIIMVTDSISVYGSIAACFEDNEKFLEENDIYKSTFYNGGLPIRREGIYIYKDKIITTTMVRNENN